MKDVGSIPRSGRSPGGEHGNPAQCSFLENPTYIRSWRDTVHRIQRVGHRWSDLACMHWIHHSFPSQGQASIVLMAAVTICSHWEPKEIKPVTVSTFSPSSCHEVLGPDAVILVFWVMSFKAVLSLPFSPSSGSYYWILLHSLPLRWCHLHIWGYWYFSWQSWFQLVLHPAQHFTWCTLHIN